MTANAKAKKESEQKNESLKSCIFDLERRYKEACEAFWLEPSEETTILSANLLGIVKTIPARFTRIVAQIAKLEQVAKLYALVADEFYAEG